MKKNKPIISILLSFLLMFSTSSWQMADVFAQEITDNDKNSEEVVNPLYEGTDVKTYSSNAIVPRSSTKVFSTKTEAAKYLKDEMVKRSGTIKFTVKVSNYNNFYEDLFEMAVEDSENSNSSEGDYLYRHWSTYNVEWDDSKSGQTTFVYNMEYLSTYAQELEVNKQVKKVLDNLNVYNKDDYTKAKAVHDYITQNITYDYSLQKSSAYDAIVTKNVVCNGYATLTYKMMKELGIGVRCITGNKNVEYHAWNIGKINNKWYNIDNTWDATDYSAGLYAYNYFLKNNNDFSSHYRDSKFKTDKFNASHPMSTTSYKKDESILLNDSQKSISQGEVFRLKYEIVDKTDKVKSYTSSNEQVAKVDKNGVVGGVGYGTATITITTEKGKKATCKVYVHYNISKCEIKYNDNTKFVYDGNIKKPSITVTYLGRVLSEGTDYSINYGENTSSGNGTVTVFGVGDYSNSKKSTFKIYPSKVTGVRNYSSSATSLKIRWDMEYGVTGYRIYRASTPDGEYKYVGYVSNKHNSYEDKNLTPGSTYYYKVRAYKTVDGEKLYGAYSSYISGKTITSPQVKNLKQTSAGKTSVTLSWSKVTNASGYRIYRSTSKTGTYKYVGETTSTTYQDENLTPGLGYYYKVKSYEKVGSTKEYGIYSSVVKTSTKCNTPVISIASKSKGKAVISWKKVSNASGYAIYRSTSKSGTYTKVSTVKSGSTLQYTDTNVTSGKTYYYKVRAYKSVDMGTVYSYYSSIKYVKVK